MAFLRVTIRERGPVPRRLRAAYRAARKAAWHEAGTLFHVTMRDNRFTSAHGRKAGYAPRRGESAGLTPGEFWRSYTGQKLKKWRHTRPLEWSGETRRRVRACAISTTSKGCRVAYSGASKLNFRPRGGNINMADEFRRLIPDEIQRLAARYDRALDAALRRDRTTTTRQV